MQASADAREGAMIQDSTPTPDTTLQVSVDKAATEAGNRLAPYWPLEHFVAVNPLLGMADRSLADSGFIAARAYGARLTMPREYYASLIEQGIITDADIADAVAELAQQGEIQTSVKRVRAEAMQADVPAERFRLQTVATLAARRTGVDWPEVVQAAISNWAADYFDKGIAVWSAAPADADPWTAYREVACIDRSAELLGLKGARELFAALPSQPTALLTELVELLDIPGAGLTAYFHRLLADVAGWAGYARYRGWSKELRGEDGSAARQLLAVRAAWEIVLYRALAGTGLEGDLADSRHQYPENDHALWCALSATDQALQLAFERAMQRQLATSMISVENTGADTAPAVQAAFCIDVRSERLRRALEATDLEVQTLGFAGFFGLPVELHSALKDQTARCPVLLEPGFEAAEHVHSRSAMYNGLVTRQTLEGRWARFQRAGVAGFSFVEALGLGYLGKMLKAVIGESAEPCAEHRHRRYTLAASLTEKISLAEGILRGMSLTKDFASLVLFTGHGSTTTNNPYASALDCGACGGHAGDINARLAADLLNDRFVRSGLIQRGIDIPPDTVFIAGLHDTTTDEVTLLDTDSLPETHNALLKDLHSAFRAASEAVRAERAPGLGVTTADKVRRRAGDWSEVRPEWGLAGCYAFVAAPRHRTRGMDLAGRSFLHDYRHQEDEDYSVLETILTAPLVVASWITLQYYASCVDNERFGSGDKTLHNVVGGVGVLEGVGGDLRTGLPLQSVHDGNRFVHAPLRLTAAVEAPPSAIDAIIDRHGPLRDLVDNGWIQMHAIDPSGVLWRRPAGGGNWSRVVQANEDTQSEAA